MNTLSAIHRGMRYALAWLIVRVLVRAIAIVCGVVAAFGIMLTIVAYWLSTELYHADATKDIK